MQVTVNESEELASFQLKNVAHIWFTPWKHNRNENVTHVTWECCTGAFFDKFLPRQQMESKAQELMNFRQGSISVQEYGLNFTQLSMYAPYIVAYSRAQMSQFLFGVSDLVRTKCINAMLLKYMKISRTMSHAQPRPTLDASQQIT